MEGVGIELDEIKKAQQNSSPPSGAMKNGSGVRSYNNRIRILGKESNINLLILIKVHCRNGGHRERRPQKMLLGPVFIGMTWRRTFENSSKTAFIALYLELENAYRGR